MQYGKSKTLLLLAIIIISLSACSNEDREEEKEKNLKQVGIMDIGTENADEKKFIEVSASISASSQVDITATGRGTARGVYFEVGDKVTVNKILVSLFDASTLTSLNNAETNRNNMQSNLDAIDRITSDSIRQAELGIQAAEDSVRSAEIGLETAKTNLKNAIALKEKSGIDTKNQAIISYESFLNSVDNALDQTNYILHVDEDREQLPGIENVLSVKNKSVLIGAKDQYNKSKANYLALEARQVGVQNIEKRMEEMNKLLAVIRDLLQKTINVLDNTVTGSGFSASTLSEQKSIMLSSRGNFSSYQTSAKSILQNLQNIDLAYNQEIDSLESAVTSAQNRLESAKTSYENSLINLENAKQSRKQQLLNAESSIDGAEGQLSLARVQAGNLSIKAPIAGEITGKYIEVGTEINPGQKIAQISQTEMLKIEAHLPSSDIYRIDREAVVKIGGDMEGYISFINPSADPVSRKVKIEILYNNENKDLIPGTFVDISIPIKERERSVENSIFVPLKSVSLNQNESFVMIYQDGTAVKKAIEIGKNDGAVIEITEGLETGDKLIIEGGRTLEDGEAVELSE